MSRAKPSSTAELPSALARDHEIMGLLDGRKLAVFLDYDGTMTPIAERPEQALLAPEMRAAVKDLAGECVVALVSGRDVGDVRRLVGLDGLIYAGSHGFDIEGPNGLHLEHEQGLACLPALDAAGRALAAKIGKVDGALLERKRFAVAIHFRLVPLSEMEQINEIVDSVAEAYPQLRLTHGKKVCELRPGIDWDKGKAVLWLLAALELSEGASLPLYIGDDLTDEDAFRELRARGLGIVIRDGDRPTLARYALDNPEQVREFLDLLTRDLQKRRN